MSIYQMPKPWERRAKKIVIQLPTEPQNGDRFFQIFLSACAVVLAAVMLYLLVTLSMLLA